MNSRLILEANLPCRQPTNNPLVESQRRRHGLKKDASLEEISVVALPLLEAGGSDVLEACELVLGHHIEVIKCRKAVMLTFDQNISPADKLEILQRESMGIDIGPY